MKQNLAHRFIKKTLKTDGDVPVCKAGEQVLTLSEVFDSLNLTAYDLTVDMLDVHAVGADSQTFIDSSSNVM